MDRREDSQNAEGRAVVASGSAPPIGIGKAKGEAEETAGRSSTFSVRQLEQVQEQLDALRHRMEVTALLTIDLPRTGLPPLRVLLVLEEVAADHDDHRLCGQLSFALHGPERLASARSNGTGMTSLLRIIVGTMEPSQGIVRRGWQMAYLDQHVTLLRNDLPLLDNIRRHCLGPAENAAQAALARFAFRNRDALRLADGLSGGERLRAGLACIVSGKDPPELLLLDEPTNHLGLASNDILEAELSGFDCDLIIVSHDQVFFLPICVERTIILGAAR